MSESQAVSRRDGAVVDIQGVLWMGAEVHEAKGPVYSDVGKTCSRRPRLQDRREVNTSPQNVAYLLINQFVPVAGSWPMTK